jgi:hypothetical protein
MKAVISKLEEVEEAHRKFYVEREGKFYLDVEGIEQHPEVTGLVSAIERITEENKDRQFTLAEMAAKVPEDFSVAEWNRLKVLAAGTPEERKLPNCNGSTMRS